MAKETKTVNAYAGVDKTLEIYGAFGWKLLSQSGIYGLTLELYRDTDHPHYEELVKAEALYESKKNEYDNLPRPVKPDEPGMFDFKGKKEYKHKLSDFQMAEIRYSNQTKTLDAEMKKIVNECRLNYIAE